MEHLVVEHVTHNTFGEESLKDKTGSMLIAEVSNEQFVDEVATRRCVSEQVISPPSFSSWTD